jgi:hypothetical protein
VKRGLYEVNRAYPFSTLPDIRNYQNLNVFQKQFCNDWYEWVPYQQIQTDLVDRLGLAYYHVTNNGSHIGPSMRKLKPSPARVLFLLDMAHYRLNKYLKTYATIEVGKVKYLVGVPTQRYIRKPLGAGTRYAVLERDNFRCVACGATAAQTELHVDHVRPVVAGGTNDLDNLQTLCQRCNIGKGAQWKPC